MAGVGSKMAVAASSGSTINAENVVILCNAMLLNRKWIAKCVQLKIITSAAALSCLCA